ncbi:MAG: VOC family protein [Pseudomonadota bacterium]
MSGVDSNLIAELRQRADSVTDIPVRFKVDEETYDFGNGEPKATLVLNETNFLKLIREEVDPTHLFMTGALTIDGDMTAAIAFGEAFQSKDSAAPEQPVEEPGEENDVIAYLDNVGLIVLSLEETHQRYTDLGFNLADRGTHYYEKPAGVFTKWGTANHCANFRDGGLLEFIAHYYPEHPAGLYGQQLEKYGNHWGKITIHSTSNDAETDRLRRQGHGAVESNFLYRYTDGKTFDPDPSQSKRTSLFSYPTSFQDTVMMVGAEHTLGEWPIQEEHFNHPNGAQRIGYALIVSKDPEAAAVRYGRALSIKATPFDGGWRVHLGRNSYLVFAAPETLPQEVARQLAGRDVAMLGTGIQVRDLGETKEFLTARNIPAIEHSLGLVTPEPVKGSGAIFFTSDYPGA